MTERTYNVLFLCTGNTARSIVAEGILRRDGDSRFRAYSAGSRPKGTVNPLALEVLGSHGYPTDGFRSKSWDEFAEPDAPVMDFVVTVCDSAAGEACPIWPGHPSIAHWGIDDPAAVAGSRAEKLRAFEQAFMLLKNRIDTFIHLPLESLDRFTIGNRLRRIGHSEEASQGADGKPNPRP
jgi:arsenate reductase